MTDEKGVVKYEASDGSEIKLSLAIAQKLLVQGDAQITEKEFMRFVAQCKSRGANPFKGDAWLIKYSNNSPAAIVESRGYRRARAKAQPDCTGWSCGIIVDRNGTIEDTHGLILDGDKLLGGWFEAQPKGWSKPFRHEVNLSAYIKKTKDGRTTEFWQPDKQPMMIMKVAESQGLSACWPDLFSGSYVEEEIQPPIDITPQFEPSESDIKRFAKLTEGADSPMKDTHNEVSSKPGKYGVSPDEQIPDPPKPRRTRKKQAPQAPQAPISRKEEHEMEEDERLGTIQEIIRWKMDNPAAWLLVEGLPELKNIWEKERGDWTLQEADFVKEKCDETLRNMP